MAVQNPGVDWGYLQWRRQDLVSGGTKIEAPKAPSEVGYGERCELPQRGAGRSPGRYRIFCIF